MQPGNLSRCLSSTYNSKSLTPNPGRWKNGRTQASHDRTQVRLLRQVRSTCEGWGWGGASLLSQGLFYVLNDPLWTCLGSKPQARSLLFGEHVFCLSRAGHADPQQKRAFVGKTDSGRHFSGWSWVGVPPAILTGRGLRSRRFRPGTRGICEQLRGGRTCHAPPHWPWAVEAQKKEGQVPKDTCFQMPIPHPIS